jgi:hypothetical protein
MYRLSDERRERMLWLLCDGLSARDVAQSLGHSKVTTLRFLANFETLAAARGWDILPNYKDLDQFRTVKARLLNGVPTPQAFNTRSLIPTVRARVVSARDLGQAQRLLDDVLPFIHAAYWPERRRQILEMEARLQGDLGPVGCRHCGGTYGVERHERICVRFGLA